jgi:hypothetical protein
MWFGDCILKHTQSNDAPRNIPRGQDNHPNTPDHAE